jgi:hypothetical protein
MTFHHHRTGAARRKLRSLGAIALSSVLWLALSQIGLAGGKAVNQSARNIPVAYDVDVAVVGGSSAGVAAAVAAAKEGAKVFVAAPRPYLGEDLCATYRLWLEPGEELDDPLAKELFHVPATIEGIRYTYEADQPSAGKHKDTQPPRMLSDGQWSSAYTDSVEYGKDVTISIDFGKKQDLRKVHAMFFQGPRAYEVERIAFYASDDGKAWTPLAELENGKLDAGSFVDSAIHIAREVTASARYVKCFIKKTARAERMLIGEILFEGPAEDRRPEGLRVTTPMQVKRSLDRALLDSGVPFLYTCYPTEVLRGEQGELAGIVMANRAGRQAVKAKVIIDATDRAWVARMAGAPVRAVPRRTAGVQADRGGRLRAERPRSRIAPNPAAQVDRRQAADFVWHGRLGNEVQRGDVRIAF